MGGGGGGAGGGRSGSPRERCGRVKTTRKRGEGREADGGSSLPRRIYRGEIRRFIEAVRGS